MRFLKRGYLRSDITFQSIYITVSTPQLVTLQQHVTSNNVGSCLSTMLRPFARSLRRTLITQGLQRIMGCILPTMHCRSQHCWELLHPLVHHCQHARSNSQHCWRNKLGVVSSVCTQPKTTDFFARASHFFVHFFAVTLHDTK